MPAPRGGAPALPVAGLVGTAMTDHAKNWKDAALAAEQAAYAWAFDALARIGLPTDSAVLTPENAYTARAVVDGVTFLCRKSPFGQRTGFFGDYVQLRSGKQTSAPLRTPADLGN